MKRFWAIFLVFTIIFTTPIHTHASDYELINVRVVSDLYGSERIDVLNIDDSIYISIDDLSRLSKCEVQLDGSKYTFNNGLFTKSFDSKVDFNNMKWLPLEATLGDLGVTCNISDKTLYISNNRAREMFVLCQDIFESGGIRRCSIDYLDNGWGKAGLAYTYFWDLISGRFSDVVDRDRKYTNTCLASLVIYEEDETEFIDSIIEMHSAVGFITDTEDWVEQVFKEYDNSGLPDLEAMDRFISEISYIQALSYASQMYLTGLEETVLKYEDSSFLNSAAKEIVRVCENEKNAINQLFVNSISELVKVGVDEWIKGKSNLTSASVTLFVDIMNRYANTDKIMKSIAYSAYYKDIQQSMIKIYYKAKDENNYVGMKYATLLYLRSFEKAYKSYEFDKSLKNTTEYAIRISQEYASPIAKISDQSLVTKVSNPKISADDIRTTYQTSWYLEPSIEADNIDVIQHQEHGYPHMAHCYDNLSSIEIDGQLGLITYNGALVTEINYNNIYTNLDNNTYCLVKDTYQIDFVSHTKKEHILDTNMMGEGETLEGPWFAEFIFYNIDTDQIVSQKWHEDEILPRTVTGMFSMPIITNELINYAQINKLSSFDLNTLCLEQNPYFCIVRNEQKITDAIYTQTCITDTGIFVSNASAKWGYYNATGKKILDCEYDAGWKYSSFDEYEYFNPYIPSEGYLVVYKNSVPSLITEWGETVIPFGEFEELRPVYNGKLWAKYDGYWGVLSLESEENISDSRKAYNDLFSYGFQMMFTGENPLYHLYIDMNSDGNDELLVCEFYEFGQCVWYMYTYDNGFCYLVSFGDYGFNNLAKGLLINEKCLYVEWEKAVAMYSSSGVEYYFFEGNTFHSYKRFFTDELINLNDAVRETTTSYQHNGVEITEAEFLNATMGYNPENGVLIEPTIMNPN